MKKEEHPVFDTVLCLPPGKPGTTNTSLSSPSGPVAKAVEQLNAYTPHNKAEAEKSYQEFCNTLKQLHSEKTFVPPVCLT